MRALNGTYRRGSLARPIVMPSLGMYTTEGTITAWLRPPGSQVAAGELIIEVTTEKSTYQVEAPADGIFHVSVEIGALIGDQGLIGHILSPGEEPPAPVAASTPPATPMVSRSPGPLAPVGTQFQPATRPPGGEIRSSPAARRLAQESGIDIATIVGTGPGGRIVEADVIAATSRPPTTSSTSAARNERERIPLVGMRRTIADRLRGSLSTTASVTLTREVDAEAFVSARERLKATFSGGLPYDALFVKFVAVALTKHPELNAVIENDTIVLLGDINVGVAVAVSGGLVVPVVRNADSRSLADIAGDIGTLSGRAKSGQLKADDMAGGTFTITNLGAFGVDAFSPIINPPQAGILGIGRILERAVVRDGAVVARRTCVLSLTFDHRVTDGVPAARMLDAIAMQMNDEDGLNALA